MLSAGGAAEPWAGLARELGVPVLWARILWARGIHEAEAFQALVSGPAPLGDPADLPDLAAAADLLRRALRERQPIRVHGDYDADGVTATAVLVRTLKRLGPGAAVDWHVPSRFDEGYGVSLDAVWRAHQAGVGVVVTVDCGSSAADAARLADSFGLTFIVTDHHRLPRELPAVPALVNPERMAAPQMLSGAGVALQLARYLLGEEPPPALWGLAAVGTVADVVPLVRDSRAIAQRGLAALAAGAVPGVGALLERSRRDARSASARDLAFVVGPRINAAGRMGRPEPAVELCLADDPEAAAALAETLDQLNGERRAVELAVRTAAIAAMDGRAQLPAFLVASGPWHEGVVGIVASRLAERYRRPAAVIALSGGGGKGSVRSGGAGDVAAALGAVASHFTKWGGHRGAGGFSLTPTGLTGLEEDLAAVWADRWGEQAVPGPRVDAEAAVEDLTPELAQFLRRLEPFGHGFQEPRLRVAGLVAQTRRMGAEGQHLQLSLRGERMRSVAFGLGAYADELAGRWLVGRAGLSVGHYRGREQIELRWEAFEHPAGPPARLGACAWAAGPPPADLARVLVLVGSGRDRARLARSLPDSWAACSWWRPQAPDGRPWSALWVRAAPPHAAALRAAMGQLGADGVVYWDGEALAGGRVAAKWKRLVPDRDRLLALWRSQRGGRPGLAPGRAVLQDLGLGGGEVPRERRELSDSGRWVAARQEQGWALRDWQEGGPAAWRDRERAPAAEGS